MSIMSVKWLSLGGDAGGVGQLEEEQNRGNNIGQRCLYLMCVFQWIIIVLLTPTRESASCRRTRPRPFSVPTLLREQTWSGVIRGQMITKEKCVTREHDADWNWRTSARLHSKQILKICCWVWGILVLSDNTRIIWLFWTFICSPRGEKRQITTLKLSSCSFNVVRESQAGDATSFLVVASKRGVFGDVWVEIEQRVPGHVLLGSQAVVVNDVRHTHVHQLQLCVRLHWMHVRLCRTSTNKYRKTIIWMFGVEASHFSGSKSKLSSSRCTETYHRWSAPPSWRWWLRLCCSRWSAAGRCRWVFPAAAPSCCPGSRSPWWNWNKHDVWSHLLLTASVSR